MTKLCPHFQRLPAWTKPTKRKSPPPFPGPWIKVMDPGPGISARFPGKQILGRFYLPNEASYIARGAAGAIDYYNLLAPKYEACAGDLHAVEAVNEPACDNIDAARLLASFLLRWVELAHGAGLRTAVPAISTGQPQSWVITILAQVMQATDYWSLHEYGATAIYEFETWRKALRHRLLAEHMRQECIRIPPLLITECGIDRGGDGYRKKPGATPWPEYLEQLLRYDRDLQQDPYVEAAFVFTSGAAPTWRSFAVEEAEWRDLSKALIQGA